MFERFTASARRVVVDAHAQALALHAEEVRAEHLLLGALDEDGSAGAAVLRAQGVGPQQLAAELAGLGAGDDEALRALGIDLAEVRQRVEAAFGAGALDRPRPRRAGLLRRLTWTSGSLPFGSSAKEALRQSLRQALDLRQREIGVDHVLLGVLVDARGPAGAALRRLGVDPADVRARVRAHLRQAA